MNKELLLTIKKYKKRIIIVAVIVIVICRLFLPRYDKREIELFNRYDEEFNLLKDFAYEYCNGKEDSIYVSFDIVFKGLRHDFGDIVVSNSIERAFNRIKKAFEGYEFSFVDVTPERVSFGGLGYKMYVYSIDGKIPTYFYSPDDGMKFETYWLGNNWYLLRYYSL